MYGFSPLPSFDTVYLLCCVPQELEKRGRRYAHVFFARPVRLFIDLLDRQFSLDLFPGWQDLTLPIDAKISLADGEVLSVLVRFEDNVSHNH